MATDSCWIFHRQWTLHRLRDWHLADLNSRKYTAAHNTQASSKWSGCNCGYWVWLLCWVLLSCWSAGLLLGMDALEYRQASLAGWVREVYTVYTAGVVAANCVCIKWNNTNNTSFWPNYSYTVDAEIDQQPLCTQRISSWSGIQANSAKSGSGRISYIVTAKSNKPVLTCHHPSYFMVWRTLNHSRQN